MLAGLESFHRHRSLLGCSLWLFFLVSFLPFGRDVRWTFYHARFLWWIVVGMLRECDRACYFGYIF